ncbi:uncharacterized protein LOC128881083 [Hylaeus volcanicus]|uniref:uncharacterized protein LOC128881083 n=1 Tax=Hylaeus volcanicus TaxID=313075 RepID=UPI0023B80052|nr:uncharacterized protein LOC128881083 [Hylaeus volcanicus]XP_053987759.1 uncharacterized protein LOC128881083 [Hylaeus volcanicus]XP_053987760.1 uncharacterized protein LOC128881083 [Hylaeus volcanicus]
MESMSPPPAKKIRSINDIKIIECRREFDLPVQFPSRVRIAKSSDAVKIKNGATPHVLNFGAVKNLKDSTNTETSVSENVKKLRIKSQDGKDLGEIQVKFLSHDLSTSLNSKIITLTKSKQAPKLNTTNQPVNFLAIPIKKTGTLPMETQKPIAPNKIFLTFNQKSNVEGINQKLIHKPLIVTKSLNNIKQNDCVHNKKQLLISTNSHNIVHNIQSTNSVIPKFVKIQTYKTLTPVNTQTNETILIKQSNLNGTEKPVSKGNAPEISTGTNTSNVNKSSESMQHWQLAKSKFPLVQCEKLPISKNKININELSNFFSKIDDSKLNSFCTDKKVGEEKSRNNKNAYNIKSSNNAVRNVSTQENPINSETQKKCNGIVQNIHQNKIILKHDSVITPDDQNSIIKKDSNNAKEKDHTLSPLISKNVHDTQNVVHNVNNSPTSCLIGEVCNDNNVQSTDSNSENISITCNTKDAENNVSKEEKYNIIKEALTSVKDKKLRSKALQALADCGIGIAKHVPITPPENLKTVHDSLTQTDVFGLFDIDSFVLVKKETPTLERIKQIEHSTINTANKLNVQVEPNTRYTNYIDTDYFLPSLSTVPSLEDFNDIDNFIDQYSNENANTKKVKQILSTPHSLYKKVESQLRRDFEAMLQWDDNGMLNIHRAVIDNNVREVQRLLLVLKASKITVDALTADRMSSLELAIKSNASRDIVQLLLEAGAQPVSSELIHDSAVILASKLSSPLLQDLLKYVTDCSLLNRVDSAGFAPLHYCALYGNLKGVNALVEAGADVNLKDNRSGRTPFFHAFEHNSISIAKKLLEYGAIANIQNYAGQSVLNFADEAKCLSLKAALKKVII